MINQKESGAPREAVRCIRYVVGIALLAAGLSGQEPAPGDTAQPLIENSGKPMLVPFRCTEDDIAWAGLSCSEESPCPVYLELTAVQSVGSKLFTIGNLHSEAVTLYSIFLGSDDAGKSWREVHERIRGAGLDHLQFTGLANGWVTGEALSPLPQDPFLLLTSDGGKTWRMRPIFQEGRVGSVQQLFFASKNEGSLVLDRGQGSEGERFELYESPDGGETWAVKQLSNKPIRLRSAAPAGVEWRLRADGPTRSFHLERREGERWVSAAAFAVNAGACKPAQPAVTEPPEPAPAANPQPDSSQTAPPGRRPRHR